MKKDFFLSKGLEKFSSQELKNMQDITGGIIGVPVDDIIYYPTGGGGRLCPVGMVWSNAQGKCVDAVAEAEEHVYRS